MGSAKAHRSVVLVVCAVLVTASSVAIADKKLDLSAATAPAPGVSEAIGDYSAGCVQGAVALPADGPGYQVMHPKRLRYFGHPQLVGFIETLGAAVAKSGSVILIGDLSQPRGGRASGGHASHQTGLDVDIWFWHPPNAERGALSALEREQLKARSVLDGKRSTVKAEWASRVHALLHAAADDARVERMFVHPIIKRELCAATAAEPNARAWLGKLRPWYGHDDHVHVRLACPEGNKDCIAQEPVPAGDGCAELDWWLSEQGKAEREAGRNRYREKVVRRPPLPERCRALAP